MSDKKIDEAERGTPGSASSGADVPSHWAKAAAMRHGAVGRTAADYGVKGTKTSEAEAEKLLQKFCQKFGMHRGDPGELGLLHGTLAVMDDEHLPVLWFNPKDSLFVLGMNERGQGDHEVSAQQIEKMIARGKIDEMGSGGGGNSVGGVGTMGFQIPLGAKKRKKKVDEVLSLHDDIHEGHMLAFLNGMSEEICEASVGRWLDEGDYNSLADAVRDHMVRELVRNRVKEVVRKKAGGGGYVLYKPNQGKKLKPSVSATFPTKLGAKRAELARFPPKDPGKLKRLRREIDRLTKDPKKRAEAEKRAQKEKGADIQHSAPKHKAEALELLRGAITSMVNESLFREDRTGSDWDDAVSRLPKQALSNDRKFQNLQKGIEKKTEKVLKDALGAIVKSVDRKKVKIKDMGVKALPEKGKTYLAFSATIDNVSVEPIAIYIEGGVPKIELSDQAKVALTKTDPSDSKLFRADLVQVQERVLDRMDELERAVLARDRYLERLEDEVDSYVADMSPLQVSLLKNLLVKKYRKLG